MLSRVAAVKAPRTHNRRRVTGSSGRRREGGECEPQGSNMSRRVFTSAVLLLLLVMMCCGSEAAHAENSASGGDPKFEWKDANGGVAVDSLGFPGLLKVGSDVFAVAEAQCKEGETIFTGIATQLVTTAKANEPVEVLKDAKRDTQALEEGTTAIKKKVDVSRPTTVVKENDIYMLVGKYSRTAAADDQASPAARWGLLLVKGKVSVEGGNRKIQWNENQRLVGTFSAGEHDSLMQLIGGGGSGIQTEDGTLVFPVEGTKKNLGQSEVVGGKTVSLLMYSSDASNWKLSKGMSADGCSDPSVVEWEEGKLIMMTACDDGRRRVYESGDKGESWTEALGTLSRVWGNKREGPEKGVGSGFITATIGDDHKRRLMLVTLPVPSTEREKEEKEKGELHLWLTDNTHIVDIGPVSREGEDDVTASSLLYKSGGGENKELIALYEKDRSGEDTSSRSLWSVLLTAQLERVKEVLATWKKVDESVSKLCPTSSAAESTSTGTVCTSVVTAGLVGFLSGNFSESTWRDEYLGVNATVKSGVGAAGTTDGVRFTGRGAGAEWPVGSQGRNQLYHFANYNFTLVATVSIDKEATEGGTTIPVMGVRLEGQEKLMELSYDSGGKWQVLCDGVPNSGKLSSTLGPTHHVVILLRNGSQGSAYVDGQRVGDAPCELKVTDSNEISHFYIGGDGSGAGSQEEVHVTVSNVLLYNRPFDEAEIGVLNPNKDPIQLLKENPSEPSTVSSDSIIPPSHPVTPNAQKTETPSTPAGTHPLEQGQSMGSSKDAGSGGASKSAMSTVSTSSAGKNSVKQVTSGTSPDGTQTVDGGSTADGEPTMETREEGTNGQEEEVNTQISEVNATALSSSLGNVSQGNNSDSGTVRESGLLPSLLLLLLGLWGFAAA
ncbi:trans-sialidase, putative [Trypanosoma cruzi]|uniref:Trans-sialidase, putative n=1 Tax=Trypanosoma cruzi (strain CL Brener) TaxID=353153 RepID=Q4D6F8_TRYCC|nr:trans-sialidase, putative [Trypanosoma cruzi]EAN88109.1 trans-sialidase, putative [Trypanosoma cruzi]|eukprot:XP_809960.1 trans-sialidase [Trypanosoma cruzi strain CL Brener]